jgi:hypothetical protein
LLARLRLGFRWGEGLLNRRYMLFLYGPCRGDQRGGNRFNKVMEPNLAPASPVPATDPVPATPFVTGSTAEHWT